MPRKVHDLKVAPTFFVELKSGRKTSEYRSNDRDFALGDVVRLREFVPRPSDDPTDPAPWGYTGAEVWREVTHVLDHAAFRDVPKGWVVLSLREVDPLPEAS